MVGFLIEASASACVFAQQAQVSETGAQKSISNPLAESGRGPQNYFDIAAHQKALVREVLSIPPSELTPARFMRMPVPGEGLESSDYLSTVHEKQHGWTMRFTKMPIPIYIDASGQPDLYQICQTALSMWEGRSNYLVRFDSVQDPSQARVIVKFRPKVRSLI